MRIEKIVFEMSPWFQPHQIELRCSLQINGKDFHWTEIFPDTDFDSRVEQYLDYMKQHIIKAIKESK